MSPGMWLVLRGRFFAQRFSLCWDLRILCLAHKD